MMKLAVKVILALTLFMFRVDTDHSDHTLAVDNFALVAHLLHRSTYFHYADPQISLIQVVWR